MDLEKLGNKNKHRCGLYEKIEHLDNIGICLICHLFAAGIYNDERIIPDHFRRLIPVFHFHDIFRHLANATNSCSSYELENSVVITAQFISDEILGFGGYGFTK